MKKSVIDNKEDDNKMKINYNVNVLAKYNKSKNKNKKEKRLSIINTDKYDNFLKGMNDINNLNKNKNNNEKTIKNKNNIQKVPKVLNINQIKCKANLRILQENLLFYKIKQYKENIKVIYNHSYSSFFSKYYFSMKKEIKIIQKYINNYLERQKILNDALYKYMNNLPNNANEIDKKVNEILFPYTKKKISKENNIIDKDYSEEEDNKNKTINISINNKDKRLPKENNEINIIDINTKINKNNYNNDRNKLKKEEEEKYINNSLNSNEKEENYTILKLIKNIPNLSIHKENLSKDLLLSSPYNTQISEKENYSNNKLYFVSKIIDIDILTEIFDEQFNEVSWVQEYKKIYEFNLINKTPIQHIYLSNTHALLINNMGNIFLFGLNENGQCGFLPDNDTKDDIKKINFNYLYSDISLSLYQYLHNLYGNINEAVLGDNYSLILNNKGKVYSFGNYLKTNIINKSNNNSDINSLFSNNKKIQNIKIIQGNGNLNLFLTTNNELFLNLTSNINSNNNNFHQNIPVQLFFNKKIKITSISCGYNFYVLISSDGKLYSGGSNEHGELCSNNFNSNQRLAPEEIYEVSKLNEKIIQVSCGFKHVIILSSNNNVYGWGNNSYGQLFSPDICIKSGLIKLNNDDNKNKIIQICAGFRSSFILNDKNEIFYFGVLNRNKKNITGEKEQIFIEDKNNEYSNKNFFIPIKINARWNTLFSLFYVTFADIRNFSCKIEYNNKKYEDKNIQDILKIVSTKWLNDSVKVPYIQEISQYINNNYMEKPNKI